MISNILFNLLPIIPVAASGNTAPTVQTPSIVSQVLGIVAGIGGGILAIFLIISLVKDGIAYSTGNGSNSVWKIIGKVLFLILLIGLIFLAMNYMVLGNTAKTFGENVLSQGTNIVNSAVGGGGTP